MLDAQRYHQGVYRGFGAVRELPREHGLLSLWQDPGLAIRKFYRTADGQPSMQDVHASLWEAGNLMIEAATFIVQNGERYYGLATNKSFDFGNDTDVLYMLYNNPRSLLTGYGATMDGLMQHTIEDSLDKSRVQLAILLVEGLVVGLCIVVVMAVLAYQLMAARRALFTVFMVVPSGGVRCIAACGWQAFIGLLPRAASWWH
jgi:hypothetical protein